MTGRLEQLLGSLARQLRLTRFRLAGARFGPDTRLDAGVDLAPGLHHPPPISVSTGQSCHLSRGVVVHPYGGHVRLGHQVFLGPYVIIYGHGGVEIGDNTLVSMHGRILSSNHTIPPPGTLIRSQPDILLPTKIGRDVWLGAGVTVLGGVTIGDGCVVGAGSVVTHDLPAYSIALGTPARVVRSRA